MTLASSQLATFASVLMEEIRAHRPELLQARFTVAEIYQTLVPYRTHRTQLSVEIVGDYDEALIRLLTGEGSYLQLESETVRERLLTELEARNPNLGIFRTFAAAEVRPGPAALALDGKDPPIAKVEPPVMSEPQPEVAPVVTPEAAPTASPGATARASGCAGCSKELPEHPDLRFCPFCGVEIPRRRACARCQEPLDPSWRFCIRCGDTTVPG